MFRRTDLGLVQIRNDVILSIAALAAREVEGVVGIWQGPFWMRLLPVGTGGRVEMQDQEVRLWVDLVAEYGINLPQIALEVQDRVRERVEQMTHLTVLEVHVSIHQIKPGRS